jgi:hypothetical protein
VRRYGTGFESQGDEEITNIIYGVLMTTVVICLAVLNLLFVIANAQVFKHLHERDVEILRMMDDDMLLAAQIRYKRTGS